MPCLLSLTYFSFYHLCPGLLQPPPHGVSASKCRRFVLFKCTAHTLARMIFLIFKADQLLYYSKPFLHRAKSKCQTLHTTALSHPPWNDPSLHCPIQQDTSHPFPLLRPSFLPRMAFSKLGPMVVLHSTAMMNCACIH